MKNYEPINDLRTREQRYNDFIAESDRIFWVDNLPTFCAIVAALIFGFAAGVWHAERNSPFFAGKNQGNHFSTPNP